jgi:hypothetical protein
MQIRQGLFVAAALCGLAVAGCGGADNAPKPPKGAVTDTPLIDIDPGIEASPDEVAPKTDDDAKPAEPAK